MAVSSISSTSDAYTQLSSMKKINSASDDAAGMAIAEGMKAQATESDVIADNSETTQDMLNVSDSGLASITSSLQRMRELSVQAGNATYTASDRASIQEEIEQLKQSISQVANNTEFNTKKLLNGDSDTNATLDALGITDYDVTSGDFDISVLDDAIDTVTSLRSSTGATSNALDSTIAYNKLASENLTSSYSQIEDLDVEQTISDMKKEEVMNEYRMFASQANMNQEQGMLKLLNS